MAPQSLAPLVCVCFGFWFADLADPGKTQQTIGETSSEWPVRDMTVFRPIHSGRYTVQKNIGHFGSHGQPCDHTQQQMLADQPFQLFIEQHSTQHTTPFKMCSGELGSQSGQGPSRFMWATNWTNDDPIRWRIYASPYLNEPKCAN